MRGGGSGVGQFRASSAPRPEISVRRGKLRLPAFPPGSAAFCFSASAKRSGMVFCDLCNRDLKPEDLARSKVRCRACVAAIRYGRRPALLSSSFRASARKSICHTLLSSFCPAFCRYANRIGMQDDMSTLLARVRRRDEAAVKWWVNHTGLRIAHPTHKVPFDAPEFLRQKVEVALTLTGETMWAVAQENTCEIRNVADIRKVREEVTPDPVTRTNTVFAIYEGAKPEGVQCYKASSTAAVKNAQQEKHLGDPTNPREDCPQPAAPHFQNPQDTDARSSDEPCSFFRQTAPQRRNSFDALSVATSVEPLGRLQDLRRRLSNVGMADKEHAVARIEFEARATATSLARGVIQCPGEHLYAKRQGELAQIVKKLVAKQVGKQAAAGTPARVEAAMEVIARTV